QTVVPPSRHATDDGVVPGPLYAWKPRHGPGEIRIAAAPAWLVEQLRAGSSAKRGGERRKRAASDSTPITEPGRHDYLIRLGGTMRDKGADPDTIRAALHAENQARCVPPLDEAEVDGIAESASKYEPDLFTRVTITDNGRPLGAGAATREEDVQSGT